MSITRDLEKRTEKRKVEIRNLSISGLLKWKNVINNPNKPRYPHNPMREKATLPTKLRSIKMANPLKLRKFRNPFSLTSNYR